MIETACALNPKLCNLLCQLEIVLTPLPNSRAASTTTSTPASELVGISALESRSGVSDFGFQLSTTSSAQGVLIMCNFPPNTEKACIHDSSHG